MIGLTKSSLAMEERLQGGRDDAVAEEQAALRAVEGLAIGIAGHLEKDVAEPVIRGVAEPDLARHAIFRVDEGLAMPDSQEVDELREILRLLVRRARRIAEIDAHEPDASLAQRGMGQDPGGRADVAAAVEAGEPIGLPQA